MYKRIGELYTRKNHKLFSKNGRKGKTHTFLQIENERKKTEENTRQMR